MSFTPWEQLSRREQLASTYSDMYKDVYGVRPRGAMMTEDELEAALLTLERELEVEMERERMREFEAIEEFEAMIAKMITNEKWQDRDAAIKGLMVKRACREGDRDYLCFVYGLPYGYLNKKEEE